MLILSWIRRRDGESHHGKLSESQPWGGKLIQTVRSVSIVLAKIVHLSPESYPCETCEGVERKKWTLANRGT